MAGLFCCIWRDGNIEEPELKYNGSTPAFNVSSTVRDAGHLLGVLATIRGPNSFVYYQKNNNKLYFAKDCVGVQNLLLTVSTKGDRLCLSSSMSKNIGNAIEVPTIGVFVFELETSLLSVHPWGLADLNLKKNIKSLESELSIELQVLEPIFQRKKRLGIRREPTWQNITCYEEIIVLITENRDPKVLDSQEGNQKISNTESVITKIPNVVLVVPDTANKGNENPEISNTSKKHSQIMEAGQGKSEIVVQESKNGTIAQLNNVKPMNSNSDEESSNIIHPENTERVTNSLLVRPEIRKRILEVLTRLRRSILVDLWKYSANCEHCWPRNTTKPVYICIHKSYVARVGILFSGGLDSTILASLVNEFIPESQSIDLINVAFENSSEVQSNTMKNGPIWKVNYNVPDRKIGKKALSELQEMCPNRRWNFIECNILQIQMQEFRARFSDLVHPLKTDSDFRIGAALWFGSRASGILTSTGKFYQSPSQILLVGTGADELFGGYTSHRTTLKEGGWSALSDKLDAGMTKLSDKTLGIVNHVVCDHGKQLVVPYLNESLIEYVSGLEPWERCYPTDAMPEGLGDKLLLRLVARELGIRKTANFPQVSIELGTGSCNTLGKEPTDKDTV